MGDVIPFKKPRAAQKHRGRILCQRGLHRWQLVTERKFDVKRGKLVTEYRCSRCGAQRHELL